jgi:CcmD family protein
MGTVVAFVVAWIGIALYVGWMTNRQFRLARRLQELQASVEQRKPVERFRARAA